MTTPHFLQMILEREVDVIVMLSNTTENGRDGKIIPKCSQYWPQFVNTSLVFEHMKITNLGETEMIPLELIKRKLRITGNYLQTPFGEFVYLFSLPAIFVHFFKRRTSFAGAASKFFFFFH